MSLPAADLFALARQHGVTIETRAGRLVFRAPVKPPAEVVEKLCAAKPVLLAALRAGTSPSLEFQITQWLNTNPPTPTDPDRGCAHCGKPEAPGAVILPFLTGNSGHIWLHGDCWPAWDARRRDEALAALAALGIGGTP